MTQDIGTKIASPGNNFDTTDPRELLMSSKYSMLKYHSDSYNSITLTPGDTHASVDFSHSLGYVPAFIAYYKDQNNKLHYIPALPYPFGFVGEGIATAYPYAYADSTKVRCGVQISTGAYNQTTITTPTDFYNQKFNDNLATEVGNDGGGTGGAFRFTGINIAQGTTITEAILGFYVGQKGSGSGDLKAKIWGIDEDNTSAFSGSPMGRTKTTAVDIANWSLPSTGQFSNHNVTSIVQEIIDRSGWSSGNAMGFILEDNGSPADVWVYDGNAGTNSKLTITYGGNQTLTFRVIIFKDKIAS